MENYRDLLGKAHALIAELQADQESGDAERMSHIPEKMTAAKVLQAKAEQFKEIENLATWAQHKADEQQAGSTPVTPSQFKDWTEFLVAAWRAQHKDPQYRKMDPRLHYHKDEVLPGEGKQMIEGVGSSGGFLVPPEFDMNLRSFMAEQSVVRRRATIIRMTRRQVLVPVLDQTSTTADVPHWFGGLMAYWQDEASLKTQTHPDFRQIDLTAHKLIVYTRASDELLSDSAVSISDFLAGPMGMAGAIAWMEDYAFLQGTGAGQPLGVIPAPGTITVPVPAGGAQITFNNLANIVEHLLPSSYGRAVWAISQSHMSQLIQLNGPAGNPSYVWQPNARDGIPGFLLGMPVVWSEKVPLAGQAGSVGLFDFQYYLIGDRQATTVESTQFDRWAYDQTSWRAVHRVDGQPWHSAPLTFQDGTTQVSPHVILGVGGAS